MTLLPPNPTAWRPIARARLHDHEAWTLPEGGTIYVRRTEAGIEAQWAEEAAWAELVGARVEVVSA